MPLNAGTRIGAYEVLELIGAGGMGEVYRARDAKLNRDVAIKVLPELFTVDPDRLARFRREAQVLASLNHSNIGHIYGIEDQNSIHALILELVDGPTLADRIALGAIPLDEALPIARQIADALECAHEQGVIHRDLKPANIKVRPDGTVKVLDFGLAKAFDPMAASSAEAANSPTLTARGTQLGIIVGTAAYMAPEQARGRAVDRRADIWAFGVVLFEMLTGTRAFEGEDISITLAAVLRDDVNWEVLPADTPPAVVRVLRRCLEKDPKKRLSAVGDARYELDDTTPAAMTSKAAPPRGRALPWVIAAASVALAVLAVALWRPWRAPDVRRPLRLSVELGTPGPFHVLVAAPVVLSPDGTKAVLVATVGGRSQLFVRDLSQLQLTALSGTDEAFAPFFSPDSQWIGFFANGKLKKIAISGGAAVPLCDAPAGRGGAWSSDGRIVFQSTPAANVVLRQVSDGGGADTAFGALAEGELTQRWPQFLPGGQVLYSGNSSTINWDAANIMVRDRNGGSPKLLLRGGYYGRYVASGHLLYISRSVLYAVPFDVNRLEVTGNAVPVIDGVLSTLNTGGAHFSVSDAGAIAYLPGRATGQEAPVHVVDTAGKISVLREQAADWAAPRFSPTGDKLAMTIGAGPDADVWIHEAGRDLTKLTFNAGYDAAPVWTPDGRRVAYASAPAGEASPSVWWQRSNGTGEPQRLTEGNQPHLPTSFHRDGKLLAYQERTKAGDSDLWILPLAGDEATGWKPGTPTPFLTTPAAETAAVFSPDGRWIAYVSNETGRPEVYVRPFPSGDGKWKISSASGIHPIWSRTRKELLYLQLGVPYTVMAATYTEDGDSFRAQTATRWTPQMVLPHGPDRPYDLHPDGRRLAFLKPPDDPRTQILDNAVFVFNFFDELRRVAPVK